MRFSIAVTALLANQSAYADDFNNEMRDIEEKLAQLDQGLHEIVDAFYADPEGFLSEIQGALVEGCKQGVEYDAAQMEMGKEELENWWSEVTWRADLSSYQNL